MLIAAKDAGGLVASIVVPILAVVFAPGMVVSSYSWGSSGSSVVARASSVESVVCCSDVRGLTVMIRVSLVKACNSWIFDAVLVLEKFRSRI